MEMASRKASKGEKFNVNTGELAKPALDGPQWVDYDESKHTVGQAYLASTKPSEDPQVVGNLQNYWDNEVEIVDHTPGPVDIQSGPTGSKDPGPQARIEVARPESDHTGPVDPSGNVNTPNDPPQPADEVKAQAQQSDAQQKAKA
jgi:hypothetical protein